MFNKCFLSKLRIEIEKQLYYVHWKVAEDNVYLLIIKSQQKWTENKNKIVLHKLKSVSFTQKKSIIMHW